MLTWFLLNDKIQSVKLIIILGSSLFGGLHIQSGQSCGCNPCVVVSCMLGWWELNWYNRICKAKQLMPHYIHIKVNRNNVQSNQTKTAATKYTLHKEINFFYCKKQKWNEQLYRIHLERASNWNALEHVGVLTIYSVSHSLPSPAFL